MRGKSADTRKVETGLRDGSADTTKVEKGLRGGSADTTKVETGVDLLSRKNWRKDCER